MDIQIKKRTNHTFQVLINGNYISIYRLNIDYRIEIRGKSIKSFDTLEIALMNYSDDEIINAIQMAKAHFDKIGYRVTKSNNDIDMSTK